MTDIVESPVALVNRICRKADAGFEPMIWDNDLRCYAGSFRDLPAEKSLAIRNALFAEGYVSMRNEGYYSWHVWHKDPLASGFTRVVVNYEDGKIFVRLALPKNQ